MMNKTAKLTVAALLVMASGQVLAADKSDVAVSGTIVPPACVPAVTGGAVFNLGSIKAGSLAADNFNVQKEQSLIFSVTCSSPMKVAFKTIDNRADSVFVPAGIKVGKVPAENLSLLGLGLNGTAKIGVYEMNVDKNTLELDGVKGSFRGITSADNGATWTTDLLNCMWFDTKNLTSISEGAENMPKPFTTMRGKLNMGAVLNKGSELDLTKVINIDGQATVQVIYL